MGINKKKIKMIWFEGSVIEAVQESKANNYMFVVYIRGNDDLSISMDLVWADAEIESLCVTNNFISLKMEADSESCIQFSELYPFPCVPCTFFIGLNGIPLEATGYVTKEEFLSKIKNAITMHTKQLSDAGLKPSPSQTETLITSDLSSSLLAEPVNTNTLIQENNNMHISETNSIDEALPTSLSMEQISEPSPSSSMEPISTPSLSSSLEPICTEIHAQNESMSSTVVNDEEEKEEREMKIKRAQELVKKNQDKKLQEQFEKEKQDEKDRIELGKSLSQLKKYQAEQEAKEVAEQLKKDKYEDKLAKERIREQIAKDRKKKKKK